jgi:hypothetical protein
MVFLPLGVVGREPPDGPDHRGLLLRRLDDAFERPDDSLFVALLLEDLGLRQVREGVIRIRLGRRLEALERGRPVAVAQMEPPQQEAELRVLRPPVERFLELQVDQVELPVLQVGVQLAYVRLLRGILGKRERSTCSRAWIERLLPGGGSPRSHRRRNAIVRFT